MVLPRRADGTPASVLRALRPHDGWAVAVVDGATAVGDVAVARGAAATACTQAAQDAALYGAADSLLAPVRRVIRAGLASTMCKRRACIKKPVALDAASASSQLTTNNSSSIGGDDSDDTDEPCVSSAGSTHCADADADFVGTLPCDLLPDITEYLDAADVAALLFVPSRALFDIRDEVVYKRLCDIVFPDASPTTTSWFWSAFFRDCLALRPSGTLTLGASAHTLAGTCVLPPAGDDATQRAPAVAHSDDSVALVHGIGNGEVVLVAVTDDLSPSRLAEAARVFATAHGVLMGRARPPSLSPPKQDDVGVAPGGVATPMSSVSASATPLSRDGTAASFEGMRPRARKDAASRYTEEPPTPSQSDLYRIVVVGAGNVGKSALSVRYIQGSFVDNYDPNICDVYKKQDRIDAATCFLEVVDMAGQEEYASIRAQYYRKGDGFLAMYDVCDANSLLELQCMYNEILQERAGLSSPLVLVGNKCDLLEAHEHDEHEAHGRRLAGEQFNNAPFLLASAKNCRNANAAFHELVRQIRDAQWSEASQVDPLASSGSGDCSGDGGAMVAKPSPPPQTQAAIDETAPAAPAAHMYTHLFSAYQPTTRVVAGPVQAPAVPPKGIAVGTTPGAKDAAAAAPSEKRTKSKRDKPSKKKKKSKRRCVIM